VHVRGHDPDDAGVGEPGEASHGSPVRRAFSALTQLALDRGGEAPELVLEDVVTRAGTHRIRGRFFPDRPGDDDERNVPPRLSEKLERPHGAESGHRPVTENDVPGAPFEGRLHRLGVLDPLDLEWSVQGAKCLDDQLRVTRRVFGHENAQDIGHGVLPPAGAGSLRRSQKSPSVRAASANSANATGFLT
jgi:hypothetical protein